MSKSLVERAWAWTWWSWGEGVGGISRLKEGKEGKGWLIVEEEVM